MVRLAISSILVELPTDRFLFLLCLGTNENNVMNQQNTNFFPENFQGVGLFCVVVMLNLLWIVTHAGCLTVWSAWQVETRTPVFGVGTDPPNEWNNWFI